MRWKCNDQFIKLKKPDGKKSSLPPSSLGLFSLHRLTPSPLLPFPIRFAVVVVYRIFSSADSISQRDTIWLEWRPDS